jgi:ABC-type amino acid transport substrate-binding protein
VFVNADGKVDGLEFDFMKALGQELGVSVEVVATSFSGLVPSLLSDRILVGRGDPHNIRTSELCGVIASRRIANNRSWHHNREARE